jgi:hypothetical protein
MPHTDQHYVTTTVNWEYRLGLLTQAQQWRQGLAVLILGTHDNNPCRELHRLPASEWVRSELAFQPNTIFSALRTEGVHGFHRTNTGFFPLFQDCMRSLAEKLAPLTLRVIPGRMEEEEPFSLLVPAFYCMCQG